MIHSIAVLLLSSGFAWSQTLDNPDLAGSYRRIEPEVTTSVSKLNDNKDKQKKNLQSAEEDIGPLPPNLLTQEKRDIKNTPLSPEELARITKGFSQKETELKKARGNFKFTQKVEFEALIKDITGPYKIMNPDAPFKVENYSPMANASFKQTSRIVFSSDGKRLPEKVDYAPASSLRMPNNPAGFSIEDNDIKDLEDILPFMLSTDDISNYNIQYKGTAKVDEADTYVFFVSPKQTKDARYFEGYVWIEQSSLEVLVAYGKAVPDRCKMGECSYPRFATFLNTEEAPRPLPNGQVIPGRPIFGKYSQKTYRFPVKTIALDILQFGAKNAPILEVVEYFNYEEFGSKMEVEIDQDPAKPAQPKEKKP